MGEEELKILLDESRREYDRVMDLMIHNSSKILNLTALIPVLIGIIVTSTVYVFTNLDKIQSDDLFYTWQYDFRWAATELRKEGIIRSADLSPKGIWELKNIK